MEDIKEINRKKTEWQQETALRWSREFGGKGAVIAFTGTGKTRIATHQIIPMLNESKPDYNIDIVVPRVPLKTDWENHIKNQELKNSKVYVGNTYGKYRNTTDLLVIDEAHRFLNDDGKLLVNVIKNCKYKYILLLSASFKREHTQFIKKLGIGIVEQLTEEEAVLRNFVSTYTTYNIGVNLSEEDRENYKQIDEQFRYYASKLENNMDLAFACIKSINPVPKRDEFGKFIGWQDPPAVIYSRRMGWQGIDAGRAGENYMRRKNAPHGKKGSISIWEDEKTDFEYKPSIVQIYAQNYVRYMMKRKSFLHGSRAKIRTVADIVRKLDMKTVIFSQTVDVAEAIKEELGSQCVSYHNKVKGGFLKDKNGEYIKYKNGKKRKFGQKYIKERILEDFANDKFKWLSSVKSLEEGIDIPQVDVGINHSFTSEIRGDLQKTGRIVRLMAGKHAYFINVYVKNSQDEKWLKSAQYGKKNIVWINSIHEIGQDVEI